jgi:hypothetical protein
MDVIRWSFTMLPLPSTFQRGRTSDALPPRARLTDTRAPDSEGGRMDDARLEADANRYCEKSKISHPLAWTRCHIARSNNDRAFVCVSDVHVFVALAAGVDEDA